MNTDGRVEGGPPKWALQIAEGACRAGTSWHRAPHSQAPSAACQARVLSPDFYCNFPLYSRAKQPKSCESNPQAMSVSISFPGCLREPTTWVNYPLWKSHLSSNPWAQSPFRLVPSHFWTLLLLIVCDVHLLCMPQNIVPCSPLPGFPSLFPFLLFLGLGAALWSSDSKRNLKMPAGERERDRHAERQTDPSTKILTWNWNHSLGREGTENIQVRSRNQDGVLA